MLVFNVFVSLDFFRFVYLKKYKINRVHGDLSVNLLTKTGPDIAVCLLYSVQWRALHMFSFENLLHSAQGF